MMKSQRMPVPMQVNQRVNKALAASMIPKTQHQRRLLVKQEINYLERNFRLIHQAALQGMTHNHEVYQQLIVWTRTMLLCPASLECQAPIWDLGLAGVSCDPSLAVVEVVSLAVLLFPDLSQDRVLRVLRQHLEL